MCDCLVQHGQYLNHWAAIGLSARATLQARCSPRCIRVLAGSVSGESCAPCRLDRPICAG
eukprot:3887956-Rhodomonas_salina.1